MIRIFLTGPPQCGKTTVVQKVVARFPGQAPRLWSQLSYTDQRSMDNFCRGGPACPPKRANPQVRPYDALLDD